MDAIKDAVIRAVSASPGLDISELCRKVEVEPRDIYFLLDELKDDQRVCHDGVFKISCLDGPLTINRLNELLDEIRAGKSDINRAARLSMIIDRLNKRSPYGGCTVKELQEAFNVTERTIRRDLKTLENEMGIVLVRDSKPGRSTRYKLDAVYLPPLSPDKAIIIFLSLLQQKGSVLTGHVNSIKDILVTHLFKYRYNPEALDVENIRRRVYIVEESLTDPVKVGEIFSRLLEAIKGNYCVKLRYYVAYRGVETERVVEPYGLICKRQNWYLVGYCHKSKGVRTFRVDQILDIFPRPAQQFTYPQHFTLQKFMGHAWGVMQDGKVHKVRLKFSPTVAHRVKKIIYHPSQKIDEEQVDGSITVLYHVSGLPELKTWIIQWGEHVEVLEPRFLREAVRDTALRIAAINS